GRLLARYLLEAAAMAVFLAALVVLLPRAVRERAWLLPMGVVMLLQNVRIVTEHLDLPAGRYRDTWQLVLPAWLSRWLLHYDHHLEHHLRPGLPWHELPRYRAELVAREPELERRRVTLGQFFREVFARPPLARDPHAVDARPAQGPPGRAQPRLRADGASVTATPGASRQSRYHGLDALRAATMLWVVVLHAALAYARVPIPNLIWSVHDRAAHPAFDVLCWWTL